MCIEKVQKFLNINYETSVIGVSITLIYITKTLSRTYYRDVLLVDAAVHMPTRSDAGRDSDTSGSRPAERVSTKYALCLI